MGKTDLFLRYERACEFQQSVDTERVAAALRQFFKGIGVDVSLERINSFRAARAAWNAWAVSDAWDARAARAAWNARAARAARAAWDARAAWNAWNAWDASWESAILLGAEELKNDAVYKTWLPYFEAFESGLWLMWPTDSVVYWMSIPQLKRDDRNRCHADGEPAFVLPEEKLYFWHGTLIPEEWGKLRSDNWKSDWLLKTDNAEHRRVLLEGIGYERIMRDLGGNQIHTDGDMELVRVAADVDVEPIVLLKVKCPSTGSYYTLRVPPQMKDCETARRWTLSDEALDLVKET
jgi:hypothetical protein